MTILLIKILFFIIDVTSVMIDVQQLIALTGNTTVSKYLEIYCICDTKLPIWLTAIVPTDTHQL